MTGDAPWIGRSAAFRVLNETIRGPGIRVPLEDAGSFDWTMASLAENPFLCKGRHERSL